MKTKELLTGFAFTCAALASAQQLSPANGGTREDGAAAEQQHKSSHPIQAPSQPIPPTAPVNQIIPHQPKADVLDQQRPPEQSGNGDEKLHFLGAHLKLDTLVAILALLVSGAALWTSRSGSKEANRIAKEALAVAKSARDAELSSDVRWTQVQLVFSSFAEGGNEIEATLQNFGKSPALIKEISAHAIVSGGNILCTVQRNISHSLGPGLHASAILTLPLDPELADSINDGKTVLAFQAIANIKDDLSTHITKATFMFDANKTFHFKIEATS